MCVCVSRHVRVCACMSVCVSPARVCVCMQADMQRELNRLKQRFRRLRSSSRCPPALREALRVPGCNMDLLFERWQAGAYEVSISQSATTTQLEEDREEEIFLVDVPRSALACTQPVIKTAGSCQLP